MENSQNDLRWCLLDHLANISQLNEIYVLFLAWFFMLFIIFALFPAFLKKDHKIFVTQILLSEFTFVTFLILFVLAARWPGLLAGMLNVDEAYFLAGAMKLLEDPVFWRSVEGSTSGPLNFYPLTLPAILGLRLEYASARVVGLLLVIISIICLYYSLRYVYPKLVARVSLVPIVTTFALMTYPDYVHYCTGG